MSFGHKEEGCQPHLVPLREIVGFACPCLVLLAHGSRRVAAVNELLLRENPAGSS